MTRFTVHDKVTAPEAARPLLERTENAFGRIPNLIGTLAESPQTAQAYVQMSELFQQTSLSPTERHIVWLTNNVENQCHYCVPAHTAMAKMDKVPDEIIDALRQGRPIDDPKLEGLRRFTASIVHKRGDVAEEEVRAFLAAGYTRRNILEVILGVAHKVISNYTNHVAETPLDEVFQRFAWNKPASDAA